MNLIHVAAFRAPTVRADSPTKEILLIAWTLFFLAGGALISGRLFYQIDQTGSAGTIQLICILITVPCVAWVASMLPATFRRELANHRKRFPAQSIEDERRKALPFLPWTELFVTAYTVSMVIGLILGAVLA